MTFPTPASVTLPPIVFGTSCLGNLYAVVPEETKTRIAQEWFAHSPAPVTLDSAGKYGAGLALEKIGENLRRLGIAPGQVQISNKLGWYRVPLQGAEPTFEKGVWEGLENDAEQRISAKGILECWEQGCELLGDYQPSLLSVHDPDEYLAAASNEAERARRHEDVLGAYQSLFDLKAKGQAQAIGVGSKDWRVIRDLAQEVPFDWVMLACSYTIMHHPAELLEFMRELEARGVTIINSAVFHAGFLTGGKFFDYRLPDPSKPEDAALFTWRERFQAICARHQVSPAAAAVQFGLRGPAIKAVALNTGNPARIQENVEMTLHELPQPFWDEMLAAGLIQIQL
ncbi:MAG: aldo/keto reductase [Verrucomicrobiota bacterium JB022]|nr:aldo/keto reductase [Verrucomicrobiota bacterium JB022]